VLVLCHGPLAARWPRATRLAAIGTGLLVATVTFVALLRHASALAHSHLRFAGWAPPVTLLALLLVLPWTWRTGGGYAQERARTGPPVRALQRVGAVLLAGAALAALQIAALGATDYRARADAILVLGAKVHPDGRPSGALRDRVATACALWREGRAPYLVLSGGRGPDAPFGEPLAMLALALAEGVPSDALLLDEAGQDTESSVNAMAHLASARGWRTVLVVSHDYHLARVRLLAGRAGLSVRTVPAVETQPKSWKPAAFSREVAAYLAAWLEGFAAGVPEEPPDSCDSG
jgi:vancomycin permeability regulator SanA